LIHGTLVLLVLYWAKKSHAKALSRKESYKTLRLCVFARNKIKTMDRRELLKMIAVLTGGVVVGGEAFLTGCKNAESIGGPTFT